MNSKTLDARLVNGTPQKSIQLMNVTDDQVDKVAFKTHGGITKPPHIG